MKRTHTTLRTLTLVVFTLALATIGNAQATRTWVSGTGNDANPCSRAAPCATFAGTIAKTSRDGEISVLDPGSYGVVTLVKSVTINGTNGAGYGAMLAGFGTGITINITDPADVNKTVRLRSLHINGVSTGIRGVNIIAANDVHIEDCTIDGFGSEGVNLSTTASSTLHISDCVIRRTLTAISVKTTAGFAVASIKNCKLEDNSNGLEVSTNGFATISGSVISDNGDGIKASASGAAINAINNVLAHNTGAAINASVVGSIIRALSNQILSNTTGINAVGTVSTDGQNRVDANVTNGAPNGGIINIQ